MEQRHGVLYIGFAPGTKNRQYSLMQNIMMRATNPYQLAAKYVLLD